MTGPPEKEPLPLKQPEVIFAQDYPADFIAGVESTGTLFAWMQAMNVSLHQEPVLHMYEALLRQVEQGRQGLIIYDGLNRLRPNDGPAVLWSDPTQNGIPVRKHWEATRYLLSKLVKAGGTILESNPPNILNILHADVGRNHCKTAGFIKQKAEESAVYIGGVNLFEAGITKFDFMVKLYGLDMVQKILRTTKAVATGKACRLYNKSARYRFFKESAFQTS